MGSRSNAACLALLCCAMGCSICSAMESFSNAGGLTLLVTLLVARWEAILMLSLDLQFPT
eukprot:4149828-Lingulodinium_polyedra.AAC.1